MSLPPVTSFLGRKRITRYDFSSELRNHVDYNSKRRRLLQLQRRWVKSENFSALLDSRLDRFMLISYNILGVSNSLEHPDLYIDVPFDAIQWESRKRLVFEDLKRLNADIVCLQEVDRYDDIVTVMKKDGYAGKYKRRTGDAKDGCAMLWKMEKVHLLEDHTIEFKTFDLRDNVAQLLVFETGTEQISSKRVVVGNIHVLFNPKRGDIKLGQVRIFLEQAHALSEKWGGIPVVLAGDFNSTPQSVIYKFLSTSKLNVTRYDRKFLSGQEKFQPILHRSSGFINHYWTDEELKNATGHARCELLTHPLKLRSSFAHIKATERTRDSCGEPLATTYHSKFIGTVDYLWYSGELEPSRVLDTLPIAELKRIGGLPCQNIGSDHLALASEFVFISTTKELKSQETKVHRR